jgi:uncharacterized protein (TIGR02453 family)
VTFRGWPAEAIEFYEGLQADNTRTYWQTHKATYERDVLGPMQELLAELADEFGEGKVFRPYRDLRFSRDKAPYKTWIGATLANGGYVQFSADGLAAARGRYEMSTPDLDRYRAAVAADRSGRQLEDVVSALRKQRIEIMAHGSLKTAPRGYPADHPRIELLRLKGLAAWRQWPPARWLGTAAARERVVEVLRAAQPLTAWLDKNVPVGAR